jgi:hypothetical protein
MASLLDQVKKNMQRLQQRVQPAVSAAYQQSFVNPPKQITSTVSNAYKGISTGLAEHQAKGKAMEDKRYARGDYISLTPIAHDAAARGMFPKPIQNFAEKPFQMPAATGLQKYNPFYYLNKPLIEGAVNIGRDTIFGDIKANREVMALNEKSSKGGKLSQSEIDFLREQDMKQTMNIAMTFGGGHAEGFEKAPAKFSSRLDKKVRFEISDRQAFVKNFNKIKEGAVTTLDNVLGHEGLFKQYPEVRNLTVSFEKLPEKVKGKFSQTSNHITINSNLSRGEIRSTLLHEAQHAVQKIEGFATGTSFAKAGNLKNYLSNPGEIEARAVQGREAMSPELRRQIDPYAATMAQNNIQLKDVGTKPINSIMESQSAEDPIQKIISALQGAKPIRGQQEAIYSKVRSQQAARVAAMGGKVPGEKGYFAQLGQLKGEMPKVSFEGIRNQIQQPDIDHLFNTVESNKLLSPFEKVTAKTGLAKLLGSEGGIVPTQGELQLLNEVFPKELTQAILEKRPLMEKLWSGTKDALNLPRSIMATADLSAPLRQGVFLVGRPKQWIPAFKDMFKYAFNENAYKGLVEDIQSRPTYPLMRANKLAITDMGSQLSSREEAFMSTLPEKIPIFGQISKGSNRAYSGFLNKLRADTFDDMLKSASESGLVKDNPKLVSDIANFVNTATGRGNLGMFEKHAELLNGTLFAPRLVASRMNLLNPTYYTSLDPFVRKEALKSLLSFAALGTTALGLAHLGGAEVGTNPTSSDFGKIKVGNTRYDIWGGFQQYAKLAAQLYTGEITSSTTGKTMTLGDGYNAMTRKDILLRFFESKESPVASFISSLVSGQDQMGEPLNIPSEVISRFIPLIAQDMYELYQDKGVSGIGMGLPGVLGVGSQTYGKTELVKGNNQLGEPTAQVRPVQDLPTTLANKMFGEKPIGSTTSFDAETYFNQLQKLPKEEAAAKFDEVSKANPELAKKMLKIYKDRQNGITIKVEQLKGKGVASGDRAVEIAKQFSKLKTKEEKAKLWEDYVRQGVITKDVSQQLAKLLSSQ